VIYTTRWWIGASTGVAFRLEDDVIHCRTDAIGRQRVILRSRQWNCRGPRPSGKVCSSTTNTVGAVRKQIVDRREDALVWDVDLSCTTIDTGSRRWSCFQVTGHGLRRHSPKRGGLERLRREIGCRVWRRSYLDFRMSWGTQLAPACRCHRRSRQISPKIASFALLRRTDRNPTGRCV
jgi:hypothetical protein